MGPKIIEYDIVASRDPQEVIEVVQLFIQNGWQPLGGPSAAPPYLCQAIVKYEEEPKDLVSALKQYERP